jgi:hypothetical protein
MGILADTAQATAVVPYQRCAIAEICDNHPEHAADIHIIIRDRSIKPVAIVAACRQHGIDLPAKTISRHRANDCRHCARQGITY